MKNNLTILLLFFCGCGQEATHFLPNNPFVVVGITPVDSKYRVCLYTSNASEGENHYNCCLICDYTPEVVAPCGLFNIGDTINIYKK